MQAPGDLPAVLPFGNQAGDFGFGKHGAHAGNSETIFSEQGFLTECFKVIAQGFGHDLQELPGAGGAAVVHFKLLDFAVFKQSHGLAVLAADVEDGQGLREDGPGPGGVGLDLGDRWRIKSDLEQVAAVAGGHDPVEADCIQQFLGFG